MKSRTEISIGEAAAVFDLPTHVLRHWETSGLVLPHRHANGRRAYARKHLATIAFIVRNKQAGFDLKTIRHMLNASSVEERHDLLKQQMQVLDRKKREIEQARQLIAHAMDCQNPEAAACGTFQQIVDEQLADTLNLAVRPFGPDADIWSIPGKHITKDYS